MKEIVKVEGDQVDQLVDTIESAQVIHTLRFSVGSNGVKIKINSGIWSPPFGEVVSE